MEKNNIFLLLIAIIFFVVLFFIQSERISVQGEKIASLEDVVFNYGIYEKLKKEVSNDK